MKIYFLRKLITNLSGIFFVAASLTGCASISQGNFSKKSSIELTNASHILSTSDQIDNKDFLNVFIYADLEAKVKRIEEIYKETESCEKKTIIQIDKRRANHYNTFTENIWGDRKNYDMMINSSSAGLEATAKWIVELAKLNQ